MTVSPAPTHDASAEAYEELRQHVLTGLAATGSRFGLVLILRQGVAAWMAHRTTDLVPSFPSLDLDGPAAALISDEISASMVRVLASMALAGRFEEARV